MGARQQGIADVNPSATLALRFDGSANPILYLGEAPPGTPNSEALWRITRYDVSSGVEAKWAGGNSLFDNVWDDRASLSYS